MILKYISIQQPIGKFFLCSINAKTLIDLAFINRRDYDPQLLMSIGGVQRKDSKERIKQIRKYCGDPDATFPSSIIVTLDTSKCRISESEIEIDDTSNHVFEIIDGQHRILGINESEFKGDFDIPLVIMPDLTEEEKAYVFSTINSNQKKIDPSLIYDLFEVSQFRSPYKTMHEVARAMNSDQESPFFRGLKMLGQKTSETETLSQGTFVNALVPLISKDPKSDAIDIKNKKRLQDDSTLPLRAYFISNDDDIVFKIIFNYFSAVKSVFQSEWENPKDFILNRTTGFGGLCMALDRIVKDGLEKRTLDFDYFARIMSHYKEYLVANGRELTSRHYPSNISLQRTLRDEILKAASLE